MVTLINLTILLYCAGAFATTYKYDKKLSTVGLPKPPLLVKLLLGLTWPMILYRYWKIRRARKQ